MPLFFEEDENPKKRVPLQYPLASLILTIVVLYILFNLLTCT